MNKKLLSKLYLILLGFLYVTFIPTEILQFTVVYLSAMAIIFSIQFAAWELL